MTAGITAGPGRITCLSSPGGQGESLCRQQRTETTVPVTGSFVAPTGTVTTSPTLSSKRSER